MTELCVTRGRDIDLYVDGEPLCGVTRLRAVSRTQRHELFEYLSAQPYEIVPEGQKHEITMTVLSLFADGIPAQGSFTLSVIDGETEYRYEGCIVTEHEKNIRGDQAVTDRLTVSAVSMTKRRRENAG